MYPVSISILIVSQTHLQCVCYSDTVSINMDSFIDGYNTLYDKDIEKCIPRLKLQLRFSYIYITSPFWLFGSLQMPPRYILYFVFVFSIVISIRPAPKKTTVTPVNSEILSRMKSRKKLSEYKSEFNTQAIARRKKWAWHYISFSNVSQWIYVICEQSPKSLNSCW